MRSWESKSNELEIEQRIWIICGTISGHYNDMTSLNIPWSQCCAFFGQEISSMETLSKQVSFLALWQTRSSFWWCKANWKWFKLSSTSFITREGRSLCRLSLYYVVIESNYESRYFDNENLCNTNVIND